MRLKRTLLASAVVLASTSAYAADTTEIKSDPAFTMEAELGLLATSGNTETSSVKAKLSAEHNMQNWENQYTAEAFYQQSDEGEDAEAETTAHKVFASTQANYKLNNPDYRVFGFASYEDDRFSGFDYQATLAAGFGHQVWKDDVSSFKYSVGPGYSFAERDDGTDANSPILRGALDYRRKLSEHARFRQLLSSEAGNENVRTKSETSLTSQINSTLAMKVSFIMDHNSDVPEDKENLDTQTAVTLVYSLH